jgi:hypothetical protein
MKKTTESEVNVLDIINTYVDNDKKKIVIT